jgi:hypothetical protein
MSRGADHDRPVPVVHPYTELVAMLSRCLVYCRTWSPTDVTPLGWIRAGLLLGAVLVLGAEPASPAGPAPVASPYLPQKPSELPSPPPDDGLPMATPTASPPRKIDHSPRDWNVPEVRPVPLNRPLDPDKPGAPAQPVSTEVFEVPPYTPPGFTGRSSVAPAEQQVDSHFIPVEDRWRIGLPAWDRYQTGHKLVHNDYPYEEGHWWNPFTQNVLKGDYPIFGQNTFLELTATNNTLFEPRQIPTATTPFESTANARTTDFFGKPNQFLFLNYTSLNIDLFHGDAGFKQPDWQLVWMPIFNVNTLSVEELAVVNPDVTKGTQRERTFFSWIQELFVEKKLLDSSPYFDFVSVRAGTQPFVSDFRGFIFSDTNRAIRLFGTSEANRDQFNLVAFLQLEKDTNSNLNTTKSRRQQVLIANYFRQDFLFPGYTLEANFHYDHDEPSFMFDRNHFLVRPDPAGIFQPHDVNAFYFGLLGDGHINRFNITNAFYYVTGRDSNNPQAGQAVDISAEMAALELSYDRDWVRFKTSYLFFSGDGNPLDKHATGFDTILDNPNFAGGDFTYWQRQFIPLFGVNLTNRMSFVPDLRAGVNKAQGQANFVNPGLHLVNFGMNFDVTPKLKLINNYNFMWFDKTAVLEQFVYQAHLSRFIGSDISLGVEYRPLLSNNVIIRGGVATLIPGHGFKDLYNTFPQNNVDALLSSFLELTLTY